MANTPEHVRRTDAIQLINEVLNRATYEHTLRLGGNDIARRVLRTSTRSLATLIYDELDAQAHATTQLELPINA